ncbi:MAG: hypothetical protein LUD79_03375 [Oscillospiraceae bacterium]|nr:hypothetical protein [Oscillospiraceae bacterium]
MTLKRPREFALRVLLLLVGLAVAHLGVTLFLQANLGSDPFNVFIQGLFRVIPWPEGLPVTHGRVHMAVSFLIILILLVVDRSYVRIGTLLCMFLGGPIIDVYTILLENIINAQSPLALRIPVLALGCVILAFGMTIVIKLEAGTGPNDLVAVVISDKSGRKFGVIRILVDVGFAAIGFALGGTLGLDTVICAFLVGPTAQVFLPWSEKLCSRVVAWGGERPVN